MRPFLILLLLVNWNLAFAFSCEKERPIIHKPIVFNDIRIKSTKDYMLKHYGIESKNIKIIPKIIVIHSTEVSTLRRSFDTFNPPTLSGRPDLPNDLNVSAHFLVDRNGAIYQLMPDNWMARHVIGLNYYSIGIENVGKADLTEHQAEANAYLICYLRKKYPTIQHVIGHHEYLNYKETPLWLEVDSHYETPKTDPGENFMTRVRKLTD